MPCLSSSHLSFFVFFVFFLGTRSAQTRSLSTALEPWLAPRDKSETTLEENVLDWSERAGTPSEIAIQPNSKVSTTFPGFTLSSTNKVEQAPLSYTSLPHFDRTSDVRQNKSSSKVHSSKAFTDTQDKLCGWLYLGTVGKSQNIALSKYVKSTLWII
jgi:hypothetical protein